MKDPPYFKVKSMLLKHRYLFRLQFLPEQKNTQLFAAVNCTDMKNVHSEYSELKRMVFSGARNL
jgi:hypothetical protein